MSSRAATHRLTRALISNRNNTAYIRVLSNGRRAQSTTSSNNQQQQQPEQQSDLSSENVQITGQRILSPNHTNQNQNFSEEEQKAFDEELQRKKRFGSRLQMIGAIGLAVSTAMLAWQLYQKREQEKSAGGSGGATSRSDSDAAVQQPVMNTIKDAEAVAARSQSQLQQEANELISRVHEQFMEFSQEHQNELTKRAKYSPTEQELTQQQEQLASSTNEIKETIRVELPIADVPAFAFSSTEEENDDNRQQMQLLQQQLEALKNELSIKSKLTEEHEKDINALQSQLHEHQQRVAEEQLRAKEQEQRASKILEEHEAFVKQHEAMVNAQLEAQKEALELAYMDKSLSRIDKMDELIHQITALNYVYYENAKYFDQSADLQRLTVAMLALQQALKTNGPFKPELDALKRASSHDDFVSLMLSYIPEHSAVEGVPKLIELEQRFFNLKKKALYASYAPENTGFIGKLYSKLVSIFVFSENGRVDGESVDAILARAHFFLQHERLVDAIKELDRIDPKSDTKKYLSPWLNDAARRLQLEQTRDILCSHAMNLNESTDKFVDFKLHGQKRE